MDDGTVAFTYKGKLYRFNPYTILFSILGTLALSPIIALIVLAEHKEMGSSLVASLPVLWLAAAGTIALMLGLTDQDMNPKEVFWGGIFLSLLILCITFIGCLEIAVYHFFTG